MMKFHFLIIWSSLKATKGIPEVEGVALTVTVNKTAMRHAHITRHNYFSNIINRIFLKEGSLSESGNYNSDANHTPEKISSTHGLSSYTDSADDSDQSNQHQPKRRKPNPQTSPSSSTTTTSPTINARNRSARKEARSPEEPLRTPTRPRRVSSSPPSRVKNEARNHDSSSPSPSPLAAHATFYSPSSTRTLAVPKGSAENTAPKAEKETRSNQNRNTYNLQNSQGTGHSMIKQSSPPARRVQPPQTPTSTSKKEATLPKKATRDASINKEQQKQKSPDSSGSDRGRKELLLNFG
jgi:hypothetical protein